MRLWRWSRYTASCFPSPSCRRSYRSCRSSLPLHPSPARTGCWRLSERYAEADGTEVITEVEADRSLHIRPSGEITYRSGTDATLEISAQEEVPTAAEAVLGASILLEQLTEDRSGEARLYLESVSQGGDTTQLLFGYQIDGVPIRFSDGGHAAEITLSGTSVTRLTLRFRQYSTAGETSLLLPLRQTLAIAAEHPGTELSVGYADGGGDSVSASWLAD